MKIVKTKNERQETNQATVWRNVGVQGVLMELFGRESFTRIPAIRTRNYSSSTPSELLSIYTSMLVAVWRWSRERGRGEVCTLCVVSTRSELPARCATVTNCPSAKSLTTCSALYDGGEGGKEVLTPNDPPELLKTRWELTLLCGLFD